MLRAPTRQRVQNRALGAANGEQQLLRGAIKLHALTVPTRGPIITARAACEFPPPPERLKLLARASPPLQVSVCRGRSSHAVFHGPVPQTKHAGCTRPPTTQHRPGDSSEAQGGSGAYPTSTLAPGTRGPRYGSSMITCHVFTMPGNFRNGSSQSPATPSLARKR